MAALLVGLVTVSACSIDRIVVAALDDEPSVAGSTASEGGSHASLPAGGVASGGASTTGGVAPSGGPGAAGDANLVGGGAGGSRDTTIVGMVISDGGAASLTRCSCVGRQMEVCGTDGVTYPTPCTDPDSCTPPGIACLRACPCLDEVAGSGGTRSVDWFPVECMPTARCSDGVICMTFNGRTFDDSPTTCVSD